MNQPRPLSVMEIVNEGFDGGIKQERERIIKLLEDKNTCDGGLSSGNCTCAAIALIKGEQK